MWGGDERGCVEGCGESCVWAGLLACYILGAGQGKGEGKEGKGVGRGHV